MKALGDMTCAVVFSVGAKCCGMSAANNCWNKIQHDQGPVVEDN